jgi:hypothetical protein
VTAWSDNDYHPIPQESGVLSNVWLLDGEDLLRARYVGGKGAGFHAERLTLYDREGDKHYDYYVVALRAADAAKLADERERYNRAVLRIDADEFGADNADVDAADLAGWLSMLRESALDRRLSANTDVSVPPGFRASVWMGAAPAGAAPSKPARIEGVIQR